MPTTIERTTRKTLAGLEQFLPQVPKTPPLAPARAAQPAQRRKRKAQATTPAPEAPEAPQATESQESRRAKTVRMGQARMVNLLRSIRLVGNLSSSNYEWHDGEVASMKQAAITAINETFAKFEKNRARQRLEDTFSFMPANDE